ncbi:MAG: glycosyltransferase family 39 protein [Chloroflexota bacterium]
MACALLLLTAGAAWLRLEGLSGWDGTLSVDEARLALAARGILQTGLPRMETGWLYTRGLLAAYPVAASLALAGASDLAARLPSVLAGIALVPVVFALGARTGGTVGALFAAAFVAAYAPLVVWSRIAWLYSVYVLVYALALLFMLRALDSGQRRDAAAAGACVALTMFAHELGVFLFVPLAVMCAGLAWRRAGLATVVLPLAVAGVGALVLAVLVLTLRSPTLAGSAGEVAEYFSPHLEGVPFRFYGRMLVDGRGLLLALAVAGTLLAARQAPLEHLLLWSALILPWVHAVAIVPERPQERYGLTPVLVLVVLAAAGPRWIAQTVGGRIGWGARGVLLLAAGLAVGTLALHVDVARARDRAALSPRDGAWLREARAAGVTAADLVMTDVPTVVGWYVGGVDYWVSSREYQKYTLAEDGGRRDVHTGAALVRSPGELQRLVFQQHRGERLWVLASGRSFQWGELVDDDLRALLERTAIKRTGGADGSRLLQVEVP